MTAVSVTLGRKVPPKDRIEMQELLASAWDFPIEDVRIAIDGVLQPKSHVEVSVKADAAGILTIVNRTMTTWPEAAAMTASWPDP